MATGRQGQRAKSTILVQSSVVCGSIALLALVSGACGSRGPLDADPPPDAASPADTGVADDATAEATADVTAPVDAGRESGGTILDCGTCLFGKCSNSILKCVQDTACRTTFQCVITTCLGGGGTPSPACLFGCAGGDLKGTLAIVDIFTCVTGTCGSDCNSLLASLLGGLGGGSSSGSSGKVDAGKTDAGDAGKKPIPMIAKAFASHWPELCGPLDEGIEIDDPSAR